LFGDLFHVQRAVVKWCNAHCSDYTSTATRIVYQLARARTQADFSAQAASLRDAAERAAAGDVQKLFFNYFNTNWLVHKDVTGPAHWAPCYRESGYPTGDQALEGYNNRLAQVVFHGQLHVPLDRAVDYLATEAKYQHARLTNPAVLAPQLAHGEQVRMRA